jgi:hypothetical protein
LGADDSSTPRERSLSESGSTILVNLSVTWWVIATSTERDTNPKQLAGALQAAIYNSLDGHSGLAGWRWMFVSIAE